MSRQPTAGLTTAQPSAAGAAAPCCDDERCRARAEDPGELSRSWSRPLHVFDTVDPGGAGQAPSRFADHIDEPTEPTVGSEAPQPAGVVEGEDLVGHVVLPDHRCGTQQGPHLLRRLSGEPARAYAPATWRNVASSAPTLASNIDVSGGAAPAKSMVMAFTVLTSTPAASIPSRTAIPASVSPWRATGNVSPTSSVRPEARARSCS